MEQFFFLGSSLILIAPWHCLTHTHTHTNKSVFCTLNCALFDALLWSVFFPYFLSALPLLFVSLLICLSTCLSVPMSVCPSLPVPPWSSQYQWCSGCFSPVAGLPPELNAAPTPSHWDASAASTHTCTHTSVKAGSDGWSVGLEVWVGACLYLVAVLTLSDLGLQRADLLLSFLQLTDTLTCSTLVVTEATLLLIDQPLKHTEQWLRSATMKICTSVAVLCTWAKWIQVWCGY